MTYDEAVLAVIRADARGIELRIQRDTMSAVEYVYLPPTPLGEVRHSRRLLLLATANPEEPTPFLASPEDRAGTWNVLT